MIIEQRKNRPVLFIIFQTLQEKSVFTDAMLQSLIDEGISNDQQQLLAIIKLYRSLG